jgi:glycosyltransferase involved in cell wall biosynthesis
LRDAGIEVTFLSRRKHDPRALSDLVALVRRCQADILHLAGMKSILLGRVAAHRVGCRTVIHLHDTQPLGPLLGFLQRRVARWTDAALGVCDPVTNLAVSELEIDPRIAETLPNGVPIEEFALPGEGARESIRREFHIDRGVPVVGMVGRLSTEKQPGLLISALPRLLSKHPCAVVLIVGDGPLGSQCQELAKRMGVSASVRFAGQRADVPRMLAAMDLVAAPSYREGFPYSALEAAAAGKPVVAFRVGGMPEVVLDGESGLLIEPQDAVALVDAIAQVLAQPLLAARLAEGARTRAAAFSIENHVRRLELVYRRVLAS